MINFIFTKSYKNSMSDIFSKLGYNPAKDKLLIIHADDVGMCHSVNLATFERFEDESISSASLMIPCPWILEAADYFKKNGEYDVGIHSTLTSEWKWYRWRPLTNMHTDMGFMWRDVKSVAMSSSAEEIKRELDAQVKWAVDYGIKLSHLDTHMGTVYSRPDFLKAYIEIANKYNLLSMVPNPNSRVVSEARRSSLPVDKLKEIISSVPFKLDDLLPGLIERNLEEKKKFLIGYLRTIKPGTITQVIVHLGLDTFELKSIIGENYKSRYYEYLLVKDSELKNFLTGNNIHLIGWKDIQKVIKL